MEEAKIALESNKTCKSNQQGQWHKFQLFKQKLFFPNFQFIILEIHMNHVDPSWSSMISYISTSYFLVNINNVMELRS